MNRKAAQRLVASLGQRLDIAAEARSGELPPGQARSLIVAGFADLDFLVRHIGQGGAIYTHFFLDVRRKELLSTIQILRRGLELKDSERSEWSAGSDATL